MSDSGTFSAKLPCARTALAPGRVELVSWSRWRRIDTSAHMCRCFTAALIFSGSSSCFFLPLQQFARLSPGYLRHARCLPHFADMARTRTLQTAL